ncbi:Ubiquitin-conjugating enzyme E2 S [Tritrichomonas foetus]|uniref:E2 ubiquitin-conjugating enzyme n=1 Tax=Tritrichomonas foetus TaxID=1144522 RepID=A0A1J4JJR6_9EUKA|nr:Ubiquitin-conjugating enzyme E2 S [Tritrichomonas foetus]|eukprot:OHS98599.1 Ubiquitin-conjugating enzyme E2 S [Tritrichomonas foetus]
MNTPYVKLSSDFESFCRTLKLFFKDSRMQTLRPEVARRLMSEMKKLQKAELGGITTHFNPDNLTDIHATLEGPENTPFEGGTFEIKLEVGDEFPQKPPKGYFLTKIFHPNVHPDTGAICVSTLSSDWTESMGLDHLLLTIRCLLIEPNPESALNEEAGRLLLENYDDYNSRAKLMTQVHAMKAKPAAAGAPAKKASATQAKKRLKRL